MEETQIGRSRPGCRARRARSGTPTARRCRRGRGRWCARRAPRARTCTGCPPRHVARCALVAVLDGVGGAHERPQVFVELLAGREQVRDADVVLLGSNRLLCCPWRRHGLRSSRPLPTHRPGIPGTPPVMSGAARAASVGSGRLLSVPYDSGAWDV
eukprot:scaffold25835_cov109-Phaeocystis_antarctica.AAC.1